MVTAGIGFGRFALCLSPLFSQWWRFAALFHRPKHQTLTLQVDRQWRKKKRSIQYICRSFYFTTIFHSFLIDFLLFYPWFDSWRRPKKKKEEIFLCCFGVVQSKMFFKFHFNCCCWIYTLLLCHANRMSIQILLL